VRYLAYWRPLLCALLVLCSSISGAQTSGDGEQLRGGVFSPEEVLDEVVTRPSDPESEWMHRWLKQSLGGFIFKPWGGPGYDRDEVTLLSYALGFTNVLALMLALVFLFNIYFLGVINSGHQGEVLGKKMDSVWVPVRTGLGFVSILPMKAVGGGVFSIVQVIIVWVLVISSNTATYLWDNVADLMLAGEPVNAVPNTVNLQPSREMLKMLVCAETQLQFDTTEGGWLSANPPADAYQFGSVIYSDGGSEELYGGVGTLPGGYSYKSTIPQGTFSSLSGRSITRLRLGKGGACGTLDWPVGRLAENEVLGMVNIGGDTFGNNYKSQIHASGVTAATASVVDQLERLLPIAKSITYEQYTGPVPGLSGGIMPLGGGALITEMILAEKDEAYIDDFYMPVVREYANVAASYAENLPGAIHHAMLNNATVQANWKDDMTKGGWAGAGRWYMEMTTFQTMVLEVLGSASSKIKGEDRINICGFMDLGWFSSCDEVEENYADAVSVVNNMQALAVDEVLPESGRMRPVYEGNSYALCTNGMQCSTTANPLDGFSVVLANAVINRLGSYQGTDATDSRGLVNPLRALSELGHNINQTAFNIYTVIKSLSVIKSALDGLKTSGGLPIIAEMKALVAGALEGAISTSLSALYAVLFSLMTMGCVLAYLIPFMPLFVWVNMIAGYLVTVVEAIVASPLAVIQMITPEGEGISGTRLERFYQLIAMAVLKPSLSVIGLLASVTLGGVIFGVYNLMFWSTADMLLHGSLFNVIALIVLYVMGAYQLAKMIVLIMPKLPDQILEWFSSGVGRGFGETEVAQTMGNAVENMQGRIGSVVQNAVHAAREGAKNEKSRHESGKE